MEETEKPLPDMAGISNVVTREHRDLGQYYAQAVSGCGSGRREDGSVFLWEMARYRMAEQLVLYPALATHLASRGEQMVQRGLKVDQDITCLLEAMRNVASSDDEFGVALQQIWAFLSGYMEKERSELLPSLEDRLYLAGQDRDGKGDETVMEKLSESRSLASSFHRAKLQIPAHGQMAGGDAFMIEAALALMTTPVDLLDDTLRSFPMA